MDPNEEANGPEEEITDGDTQEMTEADLLSQLEAEEDGSGQAGSQEDEASEENEDTTESGGEEASEESASDEDTTDSEEEGKDKTGDPLKDTQRAFHRERQLRREVEKREADLRKKLREHEAPKPPQALNAEELEDLRLNDYEQYVEVMEARRKYEEQKADWDAKIKAEEEAEQQRIEQTALKSTFESFVDFAGQILGINGDPGKPFNAQPKEIQDFYHSKDFQRILDRVERQPRRYYEEEGHITADTLNELHTVLNLDNIRQGEREAGRKEAAERIQTAAKGGSKLDRVSQDGRNRSKGLGKIPQDELDEYDEAALLSMLAEEDDS